MKRMLNVLMVAAMVVLSGCATPVKFKTLDFSDAEIARCVNEAPGRMAKADQGDKFEQYNVGKNLFFGCTEGRVSNPEKALPWLERSAVQNNMGATAFIGGNYYAVNALKKHQAKQDWADDELMANRFTDTALDLWEKAGRKGFNKVELEQLQVAVNLRGLIQRRIHGNKVAAEKSYCFVLQIGPLNQGGESDLVKNLDEIGKTKAVCK